MTDGGRTTSKTHLVRRAAATSAALLGIVLSLLQGVRAPGPDYLQFWTIGRAMPIDSYSRLHGQETPLDWRGTPATRRAVAAGSHELYLTATPLYYTVFALTSGPDFASSVRRFQIISLALFVIGLAYMLRAWGYSWDAACLVIACCAISAPLVDDTTQANVSRLYVGLVACVIWVFRRRPFLVRTAGASALLALVVLFKPLAILAFPVLLVLRMTAGRWRHMVCEMGGFAGGALLGLLLPSWLLGLPPSLWSDFVRVQTHYVEDGDYQSQTIGDVSLGDWLAGALSASELQWVAIVACVCLAGGAIALALVRARAQTEPSARPDEVEEADLALLLGAGLFLLASPLVWRHYYLLSIVLSLFLLRPPLPSPPSRSPRIVIAGGALVLLLAGYPLLAFSHAQLTLANVLACAVAVWTIGRERVRRYRPPTASSEGRSISG